MIIIYVVIIIFSSVYRLLLKDALPLTEDHFVIGDTPDNLRLGLDIGGTDVNVWNNPTMELGSSELSSEEEILVDSGTPPPFIYDYVEVDPLNWERRTRCKFKSRYDTGNTWPCMVLNNLSAFLNNIHIDEYNIPSL